MCFGRDWTSLAHHFENMTGCLGYITVHQKLNGTLTNGPRSVSCDRAIRYSGLGVRETWVLLEIFFGLWVV